MNTVSGDYNGWTFEDQLVCLSVSYSKLVKSIGRCLYMSPTVFMYPIKIFYLVALKHGITE